MSHHEFQRANDRRRFLQAGAAISAATFFGSNKTQAQQTTSATEKIVVGVMGVNGRGKTLARGMTQQPNVEVGYICDVDERAAASAAKIVESQQQGQTPKIVTDFRKILDDGKVDALVCAAPNHWHAPATIWACQAGKHVYVEKPCCHTPHEGEMAVEAARKHQRVVQVGTQRRSWPAIIEGIGKAHAGEIGKTLYARTWYNNRRGPIGRGKPVTPPEWLDWELWQGPVARKPFRDNVLHYNWHWLWHYGNGELGNNGIHGIDVARWGLDVKFPRRVAATGGRYRHDDDQETPDTMMVSIDFPEDKTITWEGLSWSPLGPHDTMFGISLHGEEGSIIIRDSGYVLLDKRNQEVEARQGPGGDQDHFADFFDAIRNDRLPHADIEESHRSTLLCHLGNIAYRTGSLLNTDASNGHILDNAEAASFWSKDYAPGWAPSV